VWASVGRRVGSLVSRADTIVLTGMGALKRAKTRINLAGRGGLVGDRGSMAGALGRDSVLLARGEKISAVVLWSEPSYLSRMNASTYLCHCQLAGRPCWPCQKCAGQRYRLWPGGEHGCLLIWIVSILYNVLISITYQHRYQHAGQAC